MTGPLDVGAALVIPVFFLAPHAARRLRKAGAWTCLMAYVVGVAAVFARRRQ